MRSKMKGCLIGAAVMTAVMAPGATITVTNTNDSGAGSLRQAIADAQAGDTVNFGSVTGTITLTSGQINIFRSLTITGPGKASLTISGNDSLRVFNIDDTSSTTLITVTISGLTFTHGKNTGTGTGTGGGAIYCLEQISVSNCDFTSNTAANSGGAINVCPPSALGATATFTNCGFTSNSSSSSRGGALYASGVTTLNCDTCSFQNNSTCAGKLSPLPA